jgi:hypothetical protein
VEPGRWPMLVDGLLDRVCCRFPRVETRRRFAGFLRGILGRAAAEELLDDRRACRRPIPARNSAPAGPGGLDTDRLAANLREFVVEHLGEPDAVLVVDETGDLEKGERTVGVQRQYTGTAGRIENSQVAVYLAYTARAGHAMG